MNIAAHMVIKNDVFYVPMAIRSILPYVKGIYIQDQMSTDGTYEVIKSIINEAGANIVVERVDTGFKGRFHPEYDEPKFRTLAVKRAEKLFNPDWLLKIDGDEIYTDYLFQRLEELLPRDFPYNGIHLSGERPISKDYWATNGATEVGKTPNGVVNHTYTIISSPEGGKFGDPHTQLWRPGHYYIPNPMLSKFHPVLSPDPQPKYWLPGVTNIHLHRTFGPKAYAFWEEGGEKIDRSKPFLPPRDCPNWYNSDVNMGTAEKRDFKWPKYILEKWENWEGGIW